MNGTQYKCVEYMGDGVYLGLDEFGRVWLYTSDGAIITNEICLEDETMGRLIMACRKFGYKDLIRGPSGE
jgi:hypothetical protein